MHHRSPLLAACALAAGILVGIAGWMISPASSSDTAIAATSGGPEFARAVGTPSTPFSVTSDVIVVDSDGNSASASSDFSLTYSGQPGGADDLSVVSEADEADADVVLDEDASSDDVDLDELGDELDDDGLENDAETSADDSDDEAVPSVLLSRNIGAATAAEDSIAATNSTNRTTNSNATTNRNTNTTTNRNTTNTTNRTPTTAAPSTNNRNTNNNTTNRTPTTTAAPRRTTTTTAAPRTTTTTRPPTTTSPPPQAAASTPTVHVSKSGNDSNNGSSSAPVATFNRAAQLASPGDSIVFAPGTYDAIRVTGVNGTSSNPIRIVGSEGTQFRSSSYSREAGILVRDSSNVEIVGVEVRHALWGVYIQNSHGIKLLNNDIRDIGQEIVRIKDGSSNILVEGNYIGDSGNRTDKGHANGEGVYIGTGTPSNVDHVSNVTVRNNTITQLTDEAIDIKIPSTNVLIEGNTISNVHTQTSGAVVAHLNSTRGGDPQIRIVGNTIRDVTRSTPYRDGNCIIAMATVLIQNNTIQNCQHRGVFIQGTSGTATIIGNSFSNTGELGAIVNDGRGMSINSRNNSGAGGSHQ